MKATLFDALILAPVSGAKMSFFAQVLRAKLGNLMAVRENLHTQIHKGPNSSDQKRIEKRVRNLQNNSGTLKK